MQADYGWPRFALRCGEATLSAMNPADPYNADPRKVRTGLAIVCVGAVIAVVIGLIVTSPVAKAIMFAVAFFAVVRSFLLFRSVRADRRS
jgi:hypothetical protein